MQTGMVNFREGVAENGFDKTNPKENGCSEYKT